MSETNHDHEYKAVTYKVQVPVIKHWEYKDHLLGIVEEERVKLFCIKCGDTKETAKRASVLEKE